MIMGLGMQLTAWPDDLVQRLVVAGLSRVPHRQPRCRSEPGVRRSRRAQPAVGHAAPAVHLPVASPYLVRDMADDAVGVLDALNLPRAHVCGASMGGMIAQHLASAHPQRVKSLTLDDDHHRRAWPAAERALHVRRALLSRPQRAQRRGGGATPAAHPRADRQPGVPRRPGARATRACWPACSARTVRPARRASCSRSSPTATARRCWRASRAPTRMIHGEADPLIPVARGHDLARRIAGADADFVAGMGHDLPGDCCSIVSPTACATTRSAPAA